MSDGKEYTAFCGLAEQLYGLTGIKGVSPRITDIVSLRFPRDCDAWPLNWMQRQGQTDRAVASQLVHRQQKWGEIDPLQGPRLRRGG